MLFLFFFFFSSRRRHTRLQGDWSSDVCSSDLAARVAYLGLYSLQHRGQESGGMVAVDGEGVARSHRGMGLVSDIFNEKVLSDLPGDVAIGHTRYSTAGTSVLANAQPMLARYREGPLADRK